MNDLVGNKLIDQVLNIGGNPKMVAIIIIIASVVLGGACLFFTKDPNNLGTKVAEEVIEEVVEEETGLKIEFDDFMPGQKKPDEKTKQ